jgi:hypothetical protein
LKVGGSFVSPAWNICRRGDADADVDVDIDVDVGSVEELG